MDIKFRFNNLSFSEGGTNFGFMNGANVVGPQRSYLPTITSYGMCSSVCMLSLSVCLSVHNSFCMALVYVTLWVRDMPIMVVSDYDSLPL